MSRDYSREDWIPWYTDDSPGWLELSLAARGAAEGIARKMGRTRDTLPLGSRGLRGLATLLHCRWEELEPALKELLSPGPDGEPPRLVYDPERQAIHDPGAAERRRPTSTKRVQAHRARSEPPPINETRETVSPVSSPPETVVGVSSPSLLLSSGSSDLGSDLPDRLPTPPSPGGVVRRDLPLADDARAVFDSQTMTRSAGASAEDVWAGFCGHFAGQDFRSRENLLGRWQKWVIQQCGIAEKDRQRQQSRAGPRGRADTRQPLRDPASATWLRTGTENDL